MLHGFLGPKTAKNRLFWVLDLGCTAWPPPRKRVFLSQNHKQKKRDFRGGESSGGFNQSLIRVWGPGLISGGVAGATFERAAAGVSDFVANEHLVALAVELQY